MTAPTKQSEPAPLSIGQASERTGLTRDTLRWYEDEGLIPPVTRDTGGRRTYDARSLGMIELVVRLRRTGMPVREARDFITMVGEGAATHGRRMALLTGHRERVLARMAQLREDLTAIDDKAEHYADLIARGLDCDESPVTDPTTRALQRSPR